MIAKKDNYIRYVKYILLFFIGVFLLFIITSQFIINEEKKLNDKIYPNVFIDGVDVGRKTKAEVAKKYQAKNAGLQNVSLVAVYEDAPIATFSAKQLNIRSNGEEIIERAYLIGRSSHGWSRVVQKFSSLFKLKQYNFTTGIAYDKGETDEFIETVKDQYNKPAKNALFTFEEGRVVNFREDEKGVKVDTQKFLKDLDSSIQALNKKPENKTITLAASPIEPEITLKSSNNLGIEELIGEGRSDYTHSIPERVHNLTLAASKFHGILVPKDKTFSFNEYIGDISSTTGYKPAYVIKNGKTVLGDGGGVCQVSTTLFRAALNTGLPIEERTAHAYRVSYYENDSKPGLDATIYSPSVDMKFKNDTPGAILITLEQDKDNNILIYKFYGKKDNRKIELSDITVYDVQPAPPPVYQDDPTLKRGVVKQVDFPASGAKSRYTYKVTKDDEVLYEKNFVSVYKPWQAIYLVGTAD